MLKNILPLLLIALCLRGYAQQRQPNVIIILTDDMGYGDVGAFEKGLVETPNIDKLAKSGLKLTQYYSAAPICSPSRAGILTGNYPGRWNFSTYLDNRKHNREAEQTDYLSTQAPSMARFFKSAGYMTGHFGKWHLGGGRDVKDAPLFSEYGFDEHSSTYESPQPDPVLTATNWIWSDKDSVKRWNRTAYFVDKTLGFISKHKGKPCFVNLWPDDVHTPWVPNPQDKEGRTEGMGQEEQEAFKLVMKDYDKQIGRLMEGLKAIGEDQNTIVIFTSDNGALPSFKGIRSGGLRGTKLSLYEGGIKMPFIISWPARIPAGITDNRSIVSAIDLVPSLLSLASIKIPAGYNGDGLNRSSVFLGKAQDRSKAICWEYGRNEIAYRYPKSPDRSPNLAIREGNWKLLMNHDGGMVELYDIEKDPYETTNQLEKNPKIVKKLKTQLSMWWEALPKLKNER